MRIRNKHDGSVIDSSCIKEEAHLYRMTNLGNCNIMFKRDGWEEVDETTSTKIIDWEQRRFELVKSLSSSVCSMKDFEAHTECWIASLIIQQADEIIKQLREE